MRVLVVLARLPGVPSSITLPTPAWFDKFVFDIGNPTGVGRFWSDQAGGQTVLTGVVSDWLDLPDPGATPNLYGGNSLNRHNLPREALKVWKARSPQTLAAAIGTIEGILTFVAGEVPAGWTGDGGNSGPNGDVAYPHSTNWVFRRLGTVNEMDAFNNVAHEIGHLIGFEKHAFGRVYSEGGPSLTPTDYAHPFCIMGGSDRPPAWPAGAFVWPPLGPNLCGPLRSTRGWAGTVQTLHWAPEVGHQLGLQKRKLTSLATIKSTNPRLLRLAEVAPFAKGDPAREFFVELRLPTDRWPEPLVATPGAPAPRGTVVVSTGPATAPVFRGAVTSGRPSLQIAIDEPLESMSPPVGLSFGMGHRVATRRRCTSAPGPRPSRRSTRTSTTDCGASGSAPATTTSTGREWSCGLLQPSPR